MGIRNDGATSNKTRLCGCGKEAVGNGSATARGDSALRQRLEPQLEAEVHPVVILDDNPENCKNIQNGQLAAEPLEKEEGSETTQTATIKTMKVDPLKRSYDFTGAVIGMVFGDGSLDSTANHPSSWAKANGKVICHKPGNHKVSLYFGHSAKQEGYLKWKIELLRNYLTFNGGIKHRSMDVKGVRYETVRATSLGNNKLSYLYPKLYRNKKKFVNLHTLNRLTSLGLAVWYMDDGCLIQRKSSSGKLWPGRSIFLSTESFSKEEVLLVQQWFWKQWHIKASVVKSRCYWVLWFNVWQTDLLLNIIRPYIEQVPAMWYKLPEFNVSTGRLDFSYTFRRRHSPNPLGIEGSQQKCLTPA